MIKIAHFHSLEMSSSVANDESSKEILAGITVADAGRVKVAASHMRTLNKVEAFARSRNPAYRERLLFSAQPLNQGC